MTACFGRDPTRVWCNPYVVDDVGERPSICCCVSVVEELVKVGRAGSVAGSAFVSATPSTVS
jgi:hypothetical protein